MTRHNQTQLDLSKTNFILIGSIAVGMTRFFFRKENEKFEPAKKSKAQKRRCKEMEQIEAGMKSEMFTGNWHYLAKCVWIPSFLCIRTLHEQKEAVTKRKEQLCSLQTKSKFECTLFIQVMGKTKVRGTVFFDINFSLKYRDHQGP